MTNFCPNCGYDVRENKYMVPAGTVTATGPSKLPGQPIWISRGPFIDGHPLGAVVTDGWCDDGQCGGCR